MLESLLETSAHVAPILATVREFDTVLGLKLYTSSHFEHKLIPRADLRIRPRTATYTADEVAMALSQRETARREKNFIMADHIRDDLKESGVEVMDGDPLGWDWKLEI